MVPRRWFDALALACLLLAPGPSHAAAPPPRTIERLIDELAKVDRGGIGYTPTMSGTIFLPLESKGQFRVGMLGPPPPVPSPVMRELVARGPAAVPHLVAHLKDTRPTRLTVRNPVSSGAPFVVTGKSGFFDLGGVLTLEPMAAGPPTAYTVTVGDLCYVALGQIINRDHGVVGYIPSAIVVVHPIRASPNRIAELTRKWGRLTPARHKAALVEDVVKAVDEDERVGACKRLAYYYPEVLEPLALKLLALPTYEGSAAEEFVERTLYGTKDAKERRRRLDQFVKRHGKVGREAVVRKLFSDLRIEEIGEELLEPGEENQPRKLLVELFGFPPKVRSEDRPAFMAGLDPGEKLRLIEEALTYDPSAKVDKAVRDLFASIKDDDDLALACMKRLVGRGYDPDIEKYCRHRLPALAGEDRERLQAMLGRLGYTRLHVAVERDWPEAVRRLLAQGARPDSRARNGQTPLHLAAAEGNVPLLGLLLTRRANLDVRNGTALTPVQLAARADHDEAVRLLLARGCAVPGVRVAVLAGREGLVARSLKEDPNRLRTRTAAKRTLLHLAARHGHTGVVRLLLARGADVNAASEDGWAPIHEAAFAGHPAVVRALLAHRANLDARDDGGKFTPLHVAVGARHAEVVALLLEKGAAVDAKDEAGLTPLLHAVMAGDERIAEVLLKAKANPRLATKDGDSPLHLAASAGRAGLVALLIRHKADVHAVAGRPKETALHRAARQGLVEVARVLLDHGARVNARDGWGQTALHHAVAEGHEELTRLLLRRKAEPGIANEKGAQPLHMAAWHGRTRLAGLLLRHKANVEARAKVLTEETPLLMATWQGHAGMVRLLLAHNANAYACHPVLDGWRTALHVAALWGRVEVAQALLEHGMPVDIKDSFGARPLHDAVRAMERSDAVVRLLLRHKANVRATTRAGWEPIHFAAQADNAKAVALLLDHKADVNVREKEGGKTPLHLAIEDEAGLDEPNESKALPVVRLLLERKADVTIKDRKGLTPLAVARKMKYTRVARLLREHGAGE